MTENSKIEWTHHTFNPWIGCQKVGPGCDNCYAEAMMADRYGRVEWGPHGSRSRTGKANWGKPYAWDRAARKAGERHRVFCASLADVFDNHQSIDPAWRADLATLIRATPNLDWMLLTKRIGNAAAILYAMFPGGLPRNVWVGATIVNRAEMLRDAPKLRRVPAAVRFWSVEPMLEDLGEISGWLFPELVIVGGESGAHARPMDGDWVRDLRDQCRAAGVPFFFKQHGEWIDVRDLASLSGWTGPGFGAFDHCAYDADHTAVRIGKARAGRILDGRTWDEMPDPAPASPLSAQRER